MPVRHTGLLFGKHEQAASTILRELDRGERDLFGTAGHVSVIERPERRSGGDQRMIVRIKIRTARQGDTRDTHIKKGRLTAALLDTIES